MRTCASTRENERCITERNPDLRGWRMSRRFPRAASRAASHALLVVAAAACGGPGKPHIYGSDSDLAPRVGLVAGERSPTHVKVSLAKPANVAVFFVEPARGAILLYPADSTT